MSLIRTIKNASNREIGKIENRGGFHVIVDRNGKVHGKYNPNADRTYDANNKEIGRGDCLERLVHLFS